jgi:hypothetical protein
MGLDTTHNAWHGPYSLFNRFRQNLMFAYNGTNLMDYAGYNGVIPMKNITDKGLYILFNHCDCDGEILPADCKLISDSLLELSLKITDDYVLEQAFQFSKGCLDAYNSNEILEFN